MLDKMLVEYCAPTLSSLKTANMFSYEFSSNCELESTVQTWNSKLGKKGISLHILHRHTQRAVIYVCRNSKLACDLSNRSIQKFLAQFGYTDFTPESCIRLLKERFAQAHAFPHEIGLFLGYPLADVVGFIENTGQNYICMGCWKVYCNECEAIKLFEMYKKCRDVYTRLFRNRKRSVMQLTVAA